MPGLSRSTLVVSAAITVIVVALGLRWMGREDGSGVSAAAAGSAGARVGGTPGGSGSAAVPAGSGKAADAGTPKTPSAGGGSSDVTLERAPASVVVVHVVGAVRRPGVYRLHDGDRVADAVARAGGAAHGADQAALNLAAKLIDGQQVVLPRGGSAPGVAPAAGTAPSAGSPAAPSGPSAAPAAPAAGPISLATATLEQLDTLDGVGPVTAQKILDWRTKSGGFRSVDDLAQIPGIGPKKLESLRAQVVP